MSCGLDENEPYDNAFIHIMKDGTSSTKVTSRSNFVATYYVYLSSTPLDEILEVTYEIKAGDGLQAGRDYELITTGNKLVFMPGIFDMPIRIKWLPNSIDPSKNNTLTISLISNNQNITMGLPGPDQLQKEFVITKTN
jgi:hypothetical protein